MNFVEIKIKIKILENTTEKYEHYKVINSSPAAERQHFDMIMSVPGGEIIVKVSKNVWKMRSSRLLRSIDWQYFSYAEVIK